MKNEAELEIQSPSNKTEEAQTGINEPNPVQPLANDEPPEPQRITWKIFLRNFCRDSRLAFRYLSAKFRDGACLGIVFALLSQVDTTRHFEKFVVDILTTVHPAAVLIGAIGAWTYIIVRESRGFFAKLSRSWFDFLQQFFALGFGATFVITLFIHGRFYGNGIGSQPDIGRDIVHLSTMALGSLIFGGLWAVKHRPMIFPEFQKFVAGVGIIIALFLLIASLQTSDGGVSTLQTWSKSLAGIVNDWLGRSRR